MMERLADQLSECWGALGLPRDSPLGPSCASCQRPLHFSLMSAWERQHFQQARSPPRPETPTQNSLRPPGTAPAPPETA
ncbi:5-aminolevulinate synthase, erythroid-specific, mitochondrial-like [Zonotrichia albicollis]|uniref:5-aminolevulinate synthase, erythroid-specific, mitochondrial-like n=1 Tax=Zonotrichia albicollis TaxID=44394 RepID=UPI003D80C537